MRMRALFENQLPLLPNRVRAAGVPVRRRCSSRLGVLPSFARLGCRSPLYSCPVRTTTVSHVSKGRDMVWQALPAIMHHITPCAPSSSQIMSLICPGSRQRCRSHHSDSAPHTRRRACFPVVADPVQLKRKLLGRSAAGEKPLRGTLSGTLDITVVGARDIPSIKDSLVGDVVCEVRVGGGGFHARVRSNNDKAVSTVYERTFPPHFPRIVCLLRRSMQI